MLTTTVYVRCLLPCILSPSAKFDRGFYLVYDKHHTLVLPDDPGSLRALGSHAAITAGRRRHGVPTRGGVVHGTTSVMRPYARAEHAH